MKINSLLFVIVALLPMGLMAQSDITLGATYLPYESTILIHVVNSANKSMRIRNSYGSAPLPVHQSRAGRPWHRAW